MSGKIKAVYLQLFRLIMPQWNYRKKLQNEVTEIIERKDFDDRRLH